MNRDRLPSRRWLLALVASLLLIVAWDLSGLDLWLTRFFADAQGFRWRESWVPRVLLHDWPRTAAVLLLLPVLIWDAWRPLWPGPSRAARGYWLAVIIGSALAMSALKRMALTSCPWDLAEFGGAAQYVSHWAFGVRDGGAGHCFPSGHASTAFAFFGLVMLWEPYAPRAARRILWVILSVGLVFAGSQLVRGAHYLSHSLWTGWICLALALLARIWAPLPAATPASGGTRG